MVPNLKTEFFPKNKVWLYAVNIKTKNKILLFGLYKHFLKDIQIIQTVFTVIINHGQKGTVTILAFVHDFM